MSAADRARFLLITSCGLGLAPFATGTFGTLGGIAVAVVLQLFCSGLALAVALAVAALVLLALGCSMTSFVQRTFPHKDPGAFVLDEVVGYLVALALVVAFHGGAGVLVHGVTFFAFRAFDVIKPFPADRLERVHGAAGIMLDDVMAGIYAGVAAALATWLLPI
jgi:phosphatidylglycerophosphatase A